MVGHIDIVRMRLELIQINYGSVKFLPIDARAYVVDSLVCRDLQGLYKLR